MVDAPGCKVIQANNNESDFKFTARNPISRSQNVGAK